MRAASAFQDMGISQLPDDLTQFEVDRSDESSVHQEEEEAACIKEESKEEASVPKKVRYDL